MKLDRRGLIAGCAALAAALPLRALSGAEDRMFLNRIVVEDGRVWIAAMIGDKGPYFFIVDTGSYVSMIEDAFAKSMGFTKVTSRQSVGIGGISDYSWYNAGTVTLASGIRFPEMLFAGMRMRPSKDAVGLFGAGLFTTYDSDLDFAKGEWRAYPGGRPNFDGLTRLKSRFTDWHGGQRIVADASLDGYEGDFLLDTGAPGEVLLFGRAAAKSGLWSDSQPYAPSPIAGIGQGRVPARLVRAKRLKMGPFVFENPLVHLAAPGTPGSGQDGIVGLQTLARLHLTTDVSEHAVYAASNNVPMKPGGYPLSGLWLDEDKGRISIDDVGTGSPAALAGLRKGDVLAGAMPELLRAINGPPGKQVAVTVESKGVKREVRYTLRPWL